LVTLRAYKSNETIKKIGKNGPVGTIKKTTGLSRTIIEKHLPKLIKTGLVKIHNNGNIAVRSRKWSSYNLPELRKIKLIPIQVQEKFTDTKICVAYVRVHSKLKSQERQIRKKAKQIELLSTSSQNRPLSKGEYKLLKKLYRRDLTLRKLAKNYRSTCTISNLSFHKILKDTDLPNSCNINSGKHFKMNLVRLGLIKQERILKLKYPNVKDLKFLENENELLCFGGLFRGVKGIVLEESPNIIVIDMYSVGNKKNQVK